MKLSAICTTADIAAWLDKRPADEVFQSGDISAAFNLTRDAVARRVNRLPAKYVHRMRPNFYVFGNPKAIAKVRGAK